MSHPENDDECIDFKNPHDASSRLFDLRLLIGALFSVYGVVLFAASFFTTDQARAKAGGVNINLWLGIAMFVVGVFFLVWARTRPLHLRDTPADAPSAGGPPGIH